MKKWQLMLLMILSFYIKSAWAQKKDTLKNSHYYSTTIGVTNNGISLIPSFSLDKPAGTWLTSFGSSKISFDTDIRFSLDGKPWNFLFWSRYKWFHQSRFQVNTGINLSLNFRSSLYPVNGVPQESIAARRYLAGEFYPRYFITKSVSLGVYYLYTRGVDQGTIKNTQFITLNASFAHLNLSHDFYLTVNPQIYYLFQDGKNGYYYNSTFILSKNSFPVSISSVVNHSIRNNIAGSKNLVWNVSLIYSFRKNFKN